jgi:ribonucleoside-diphosphate reductase alpha chain
LELTGQRLRVWQDRYQLKDSEGKPVETSIEQTWRRVAKAIASIEPDNSESRPYWEDKFYSILEDFKFVPGGRILASAGAPTETTLANCFALPCPDDSRQGIISSLGNMVEVMSAGGGVGINLSTIRPRGSYISTKNGVASGPVSWAQLYSVATGDVIQQGGTRRGALLLLLDISHPDIEEYITAKREQGRLQYCNMSVAISDAFIDAVKGDADWDLVFQGKTWKTVKARYLWRLIAQSAWDSGEPGLFFLERVNKLNNTWYFEEIHAPNACIRGNQRVLTDHGLVPIEQLAGKTSRIWSDGTWRDATVWSNGVKPVYRLLLNNGMEIQATADHKITIGEEVEVQDTLGLGITPPLGDGWPGGDSLGLLPDTWEMLGFLQGDGGFRQDCGGVTLNIGFKDEDVLARIPGGGKWHGGRTVYYHQEHTLSKLVTAVGMHRRRIPERQLPESLFRADVDSVKAFLRGLFSANGTVAVVNDHPRVSLKGTCWRAQQQVQLLLHSLGFSTYITKNKGKAVRFANGTYKCLDSYDVNLSGSWAKKFGREIGFIQEYKNEKLAQARDPECFKQNTSKVISVEWIGDHEVFDFNEPETSHGWVNGFVVHNCSELPLPDWGACLLGSINLVPFVKDGKIDYAGLRETVAVAVRFLDNVTDLNYSVLPQIDETAKKSRRIGLGVMGLADALILLKVRYGSQESLRLIKSIFQTIRNAAYTASVDLAIERGSFPAFDPTWYTESPTVQRLPQGLQDRIKTYGIRNACLLTCPPTGTTSILAGVSSGIEPNFSFVTKRVDRLGEHLMIHPLYDEWWKSNQPSDADPPRDVPDYFVTAQELSVEEHIKVQAAIQQYTDSSISKTINAPNSATVEEVEEAYMLAYDLGCKGVTYFRDGSREGVLSDATKEKVVASVVQDQISESPTPREKESTSLIDRPFEPWPGLTYKVRVPLEDGNLSHVYVTVTGSRDADTPLEVFINSGVANRADHDIIARLVSHSLRSGVPLDEVIDNLWKVKGYVPVFGQGKRPITCIANALGYCLEQWRSAKSDQADDTSAGESNLKSLPATADKPEQDEARNEQVLGVPCPECKNGWLIRSGGCQVCDLCGFSPRCGD